MSGFADNLIARAQGTAEAIQPIVPSLFESPIGPGGMDVIETVEAEPAREPVANASQTEPANSGRVRPIQRPEPETYTNARHDAGNNLEFRLAQAPEVQVIETQTVVAQSELPQQQRDYLPPPAPPRSPSAPIIGEISVPKPFPVPVETRLVVEHEREIVTIERSLTPIDRDIPQAGITPRETPALAPVQPKFQPPSPRRQESLAVHHVAAPSAPDVHVTIGRIEIRAAAPHAPAPRRTSKPVMSLDEYQSQRRREDSR